MSEQPPLSVFVVPSRRLYEKGGNQKWMTHEQHHKAHTYILLNCGEVTPYIQEFYEVAPRMYQGEQVASLRDKYFAQWFEQKVSKTSK